MRNATLFLAAAALAATLRADRLPTPELITFPAPPVTQNLAGGGCSVAATTWEFFGDGAFISLDCPETSWTLFAENSDRGLRIGPVWLRRAPNTPGIQVLQSAHPAEIYTVYHTGATSDRLSDTRYGNSHNAIAWLDSADLGPSSILITSAARPKPTMAVELHDRGISWMCKSPNPGNPGTPQSHTRRGMEMVLWSVWDTGNYEYIIQYIFRDDGQISFRAGVTGFNNEGIGPSVSHMHDVLWRVDVNLGSGANTPLLWSHFETGLAAFDVEMPFNNDREGAMDLDPLRFTTLVIEDQTTNASGNRIGYELQPFRTGTARHYSLEGPGAYGEGWSLHDTWVTRNTPAEALAARSVSPWYPADKYLLGDATSQFGVFNQEPVKGQDIVLWHLSSAHHEPHDEDNAGNDPTHGYKGITLMHWSGFDLVPHNLFDANPLGAPHRSICDGSP